MSLLHAGTFGPLVNPDISMYNRGASGPGRGDESLRLCEELHKPHSSLCFFIQGLEQAQADQPSLVFRGVPYQGVLLSLGQPQGDRSPQNQPGGEVQLQPLHPNRFPSAAGEPKPMNHHLPHFLHSKLKSINKDVLDHQTVLQSDPVPPRQRTLL